MSQNSFQITELQKIYNKRAVLNLNKLNIQKGSITSIIGPSGAGKSTLINILCGIEAASNGRIEFDGEPYPISGKLDLKLRRQLATVFQKPVMFDKSIYENIAYGLKLRKLPNEGIKQQVNEIAIKIGLGDMLGSNAKKLSGGEMQRVALARAIVLKPTVLFMDEATTNLDPTNVMIIEELVRYANEAYGTTVILATHNIHQAKRLSNRCVFLLNGELVEEGYTKSMLEHAVSPITKAFIEGEIIF